MDDLEKLVKILQSLHVEPSAIDTYYRALAVLRVLQGEAPEAVAKELKIGKRWLTQKAQNVTDQGLVGFFPKLAEQTDEQFVRRRKLGIAQMLLGTLAERQFEILSQQITGGRQLVIEDHVRSGTDTDYLLKNGNNNPVCRMNIKFHGTLFRQAQDIVGLAPEDCFALATYKIQNALRRQEKEALPYVFLVLSVRDLNAESLAARIPTDFVWALCVVGGKRLVEDAIARELARPAYQQQFEGVLSRIAEGGFRIISARRAFDLLKEKLFERVFALRVRAFNQNYRNAEIDMHFSLSQDLTPLNVFLEMLAKESLHVMNVRLDRGEI